MSDPLHETFCDYIYLKNYFNKWTFDVKNGSKGLYNFISPNAITKRHDIIHFRKISNVFKSAEQRQEFFISGFLNNRRMWIGDFYSEDVIDLHKLRLKTRTALLYTFNKDVNNIIDYIQEHNTTFKELFKVNGQRPKIMNVKSDIWGGVTDETLAILDKYFKYTSQETINPLWDEERLRYHKYGKLLHIEDVNQIKPTLNKLIATNLGC